MWHRNNRGVSLIEALVSVSLILIFSLSILKILQVGHLGQTIAARRSQGLALAHKAMVSISNISYFKVFDADSAAIHYGLFANYPYKNTLDRIQNELEDKGFTSFTIETIFMRRDISDINGNGSTTDLVEFADLDLNGIDDYDDMVRYQDVADDSGSGTPSSPSPDGDYWDTYEILLDGKVFLASEEPNTHLKKVTITIYRDAKAIASITELISAERFSGEENPASGSTLSLLVNSPSGFSYFHDHENLNYNPTSLAGSESFAVSPLIIAGESAPSANVHVYYGDIDTETDISDTDVSGAFSFSASTLASYIVEGENVIYAKTTKGGTLQSPYTIRKVIYDKNPPAIGNNTPLDGLTVATPTPYISALASDTPTLAGATPSGIDSETIVFTLNGAPEEYTYLEANGEAFIVDGGSGLLPILANGAYTVSLTVDDYAHYTRNKTWSFTVAYDSSDATAPLIDTQSPSTSTGQRFPSIGARLRDPESGINLATLSLLIDGISVLDSTNILDYYRPSTGVLAYIPPLPFDDGSSHTVAISGSNWAVPPQSSSLEWTFNVDLTLITPPLIVNTVPGSVAEGDSVIIQAFVSDSGGIDTVYLHWGEGDPGCSTIESFAASGAVSTIASFTIPTTVTGTLYYYVKAIDTHGNISYHEDGTINATPDISFNNTPHQIVVTSETVPPTVTHTPFTSTIEAGSSPTATIQAVATDNVAISAVDLYYMPPGTGIYSVVSMSLIGADTYQGSIPDIHSIGHLAYYISASDNALPTPNTTRHPLSGDHTFAIIDTTPPVIAHTPISDSQPRGVNLAVSCQIDDQVEVTTAALFYRKEGATYIEAPMSLTSGDLRSGTWSATIPGSYLTTGNMQYYISASDSVPNNALEASALAPHTFTVASLLNILIVDDDTYRSGTPRQHYEVYYQEALEAKGYVLGSTLDIWDTADNGYYGPSATVLNNYEIVIWITASWRSRGLYSADRTHLATYLDSGGRVFFCGEDLPKDLNSSSSERNFMRTYLRINYVQREASKMAIIGNSAITISNGISITQTNRYNMHGYSDMDSLDTNEIRTISTPGLEVLFDFNNSVYASAGTGSEICGVQYDSGTYKIVFLSFGLESITSTATRNLLMDRIIDWLSI